MANSDGRSRHCLQLYFTAKKRPSAGPEMADYQACAWMQFGLGKELLHTLCKETSRRHTSAVQEQRQVMAISAGSKVAHLHPHSLRVDSKTLRCAAVACLDPSSSHKDIPIQKPDRSMIAHSVKETRRFGPGVGCWRVEFT